MTNNDDVLHILKDGFPSTSRNYGMFGLCNRLNEPKKFYSVEDMKLVKSIMKTTDIKICIANTEEELLNKDHVMFAVIYGQFFFNFPEKLHDQIWELVPAKKFSLMIELIAISAIGVNFNQHLTQQSEGETNDKETTQTIRRAT